MPDSVQQNTRVGKKPRAFPERRGSQRSITRTGIVCQWSCQALACDPQWGERCSCGGSVACGRQCQAEDREDARRLEHRGDDQWCRQEAATWQRERVMKRSVRNRCPGPDSIKKKTTTLKQAAFESERRPEISSCLWVCESPQLVRLHPPGTPDSRQTLENRHRVCCHGVQAPSPGDLATVWQQTRPREWGCTCLFVYLQFWWKRVSSLQPQIFSTFDPANESEDV